MLAGSYVAIGSESGSISNANLEQLRSKVEQTRATLETEDPDLIATLDREDLLGDLFHAGMQGYYAQYTALGELMGLQADGQTLLLAGMGTFGYEPKVNRLFGFPVSKSPGGVALDSPIAGVQLTGGLDQQETARFSQQLGLLSSALEHATPDILFDKLGEPQNAVSAVKALILANQQGQRTYELTKKNIADTLRNLNLAFEAEQEIKQALNAGLTVIAHIDPIESSGWSGASYIILQPGTGSGAYKISGGLNGGVESFSANLRLNAALLLGGQGKLLRLAPIASGFVLFAQIIDTVNTIIKIVNQCWDDLDIANVMAIFLCLCIFVAMGSGLVSCIQACEASGST